MNINEAIEATAKKQSECKRLYIKSIILGLFFTFGVLLIGGEIVMYIFDSSGAGDLFAAVYLPFIILAINISACYALDAEKDYTSFFKNTFIRIAIKDVNTIFKYDPQAGISKQEFRKINIYSRDRFRAEDLISGTYNGVKFNLSEAISIPRDAKLKLGDSPGLNLISLIFFAWSTMKDMQAFSGSVLVCEFYKKFSGQTIVASRTLNTKFIGEKEQMDDTLFNDEFRVFTDDKVGARYLLTPAFMERLRELKIKFAGEMGVSAAFMDDKFYLFLNGAKNKFETTLFSPPPSLEDAAQIKKEISELLSIIDELNLNLDLSGAAILAD